MTTVLLMRHGEIPQAEPRRFVGRRNPSLTERGREQARAWAPVLAGLPLAGAWCSDLARCRETAALALTGAGLAATPLPDLREVSMGVWEGLTTEEVRARFPDEYARRGADIADIAPTGGESFRQCQDRVWNALSKILAVHSGVLLIVAHAGVNRALICRVLDLPLRRLFLLGQDHCGLNVLEFPENGHPELRALNTRPGTCADASRGFPSPPRLSGVDAAG